MEQLPLLLSNIELPALTESIRLLLTQHGIVDVIGAFEFLTRLSQLEHSTQKIALSELLLALEQLAEQLPVDYHYETHSLPPLGVNLPEEL